MKRQYYYLVSSLVELTREFDKKIFTVLEFLSLCEEQLDAGDFNNLKKIYLLNDIKNAIDYYENKEKFEYKYPAYYSPEEFRERLSDTDTFLPFLGEFHYNKKNEKRLYPDLMETDELVLLFYLNIDDINDNFLRKYFLFELDIRNITTALEMKRNSLPYNNKLLPFGDEYRQMIKSTSPDFGLGEHAAYVNRLVESYKNDDLVKIENTIENIRWDFLDEESSLDVFSMNFIYSYAIRLNSIERWSGLTVERGEEVLNSLISRIKSIQQIT